MTTKFLPNTPVVADSLIMIRGAAVVESKKWTIETPGQFIEFTLVQKSTESPAEDFSWVVVYCNPEGKAYFIDASKGFQDSNFLGRSYGHFNDHILPTFNNIAVNKVVKVAIIDVIISGDAVRVEKGDIIEVLWEDKVD